MIVATRVRDLPGFTGAAALYRLSEPVPVGGRLTEYAVVSAVDGFLAHETVIFEGTPDGIHPSWARISEVEGVADHEAAIADAGWVLAEDAPLIRVASLTGGAFDRGYVQIARPLVDGFSLEVGLDENGMIRVSVEVCANNGVDIRQRAADAVVALDRLEGLGIVHGGGVP